MPTDATIVPLAPAARRDVPREQPQRLPREQPEQPAREQPARSIETTSAPERTSRPPRRRLVRWASFALLPFALIAGAFWYVTGGQMMSTDDGLPHFLAALFGRNQRGA
jgi:membrane fusion protein (multidrug efflux system)